MNYFKNPLETSTPASNISLNESNVSELECIQKSFSNQTKILLENEIFSKELSILKIENETLRTNNENQTKKLEVEKEYFNVIFF